MEPQARYGHEAAPADATIHGRIVVVRGQKVILDRDIAELYGVPVKQLKQAVRRNMDRFPEDFMFELTKQEAEVSRSQFVALNQGQGSDAAGNEGVSRSQFVTLKQGQNVKYAPFAFTEHGILMLANVLRSERAIAVSIHIIRVFVRMREALSAQQGIVAQLEQLATRVDGHDVDIAAILRAVRQLQEKPAAPRKPIGY